MILDNQTPFIPADAVSEVRPRFRESRTRGGKGMKWEKMSIDLSSNEEGWIEDSEEDLPDFVPAEAEIDAEPLYEIFEDDYGYQDKIIDRWFQRNGEEYYRAGESYWDKE